MKDLCNNLIILILLVSSMVWAEDLKNRDRVTFQGPVEGHAWTSTATLIEFVWIPVLKIWVGKYEVTNGEYRKFKRDHDSSQREGYNLNGDDQPVVMVNFEDAKEYSQWLTQVDGLSALGYKYRLPSEDEWMSFAQCGDGRLYPWGNGMPPSYGNYYGQEFDIIPYTQITGYNDGFPAACPVEKSGMNDWGLYGVGGNVWESTACDKSGVSFGAWRGASWYYDGLPNPMKCSCRFDFGSELRIFYCGFRLVLSR